MDTAITHQKVPVSDLDRQACLGPDGAVSLVTACLRMVSGRWKLPILFRLYVDGILRSSQLLRDISGVSQKMLTQHLRALEDDRLIARIEYTEQPPRVEYHLTDRGLALMPVLLAARQFAEDHAR